MKFTYSIKTLGCKANIYDSLVLERELNALGGDRAQDDTLSPDVFILNSCTVTADADKRARKEVKTIKQKQPETFTVVTGCYAQVSRETIQQIPEVDAVIGNDKKGALSNLIAEKLGLPIQETDNTSDGIYWGQLPIHAGKTRAFLKIQEGCNDYCTYCIIPYARGKSRSVVLQKLLSEIVRLTDSGVKEVVLTGINIADYGLDHSYGLEDLIESILVHTSIPRLRLTSLDPEEITPRMLRLMKDHPRLMPHFHVSLQNTVDGVLRGMKRRYRRQHVVECLTAIDRLNPNIYTGMDYIAGFPGETAEDHRSNMQLLSELPWTRLHVFPYSEREGTPALKIKSSIPMSERKSRVKELIALSNEKQRLFVKKFIGQTLHDVLIESYHVVDGKHFVVGHAGNYLRVLAIANSAQHAKSLLNTIIAVEIKTSSLQQSLDWTLEGYPVVLH